MQEHSQYQDIVLIGGGHSHAIVLQKWAENPLPGARLTLVSPLIQSAYSDMLPGMIAGHYRYNDIQIDLPRLCRAAGARFIHACAHQINLADRTVSLLGRPDLPFDLLSLDVGATPNRNIPGSELAIPIKPISHFHRYWQQLKQQIHTNHQPFKLGVVGGGASGCELAMAMAWALEEQVYSGRVELHVLQAGQKIPQDYPLLARSLVAREFARLKVLAHRNWRVSEITPHGVHSDEGQFLALDKVVLCTEASAPPWLTESELVLDDSGFLLTDDCLRAQGQRHIFASGDVASIHSNPAAKSSATALQQGRVLYHNLRATLLNRPLKHFRPTRAALSVLSCGNRRAIATHSGLATVGRLIWLAKDYSNREFVRRINAQASTPAPVNSWPDFLRGSALRPGQRIISRRLAMATNQPLASGANESLPPTATPLNVPAGKSLIQHSQQLRAPVSDPWLFGRLAALHTLSPLFAAQAQPINAQALVTLPQGAPEIARRDLRQLLDGAQKELDRYHCALSGGNNSEGTSLQLGLIINALADRQAVPDATGARAGDCLILSKPIGNGALLAADAQGRGRARWLQPALDAMLQSNAPSAEVFANHKASAVTTVANLGLLGHLLEILQWRQSIRSDEQGHSRLLGASLFADALPLLPGASYCAEKGFQATSYRDNARAFGALQNPAAWQADTYLPLLADPQFCGGLLATVPAESTDACITALHAAGSYHAAVIGFIDELPVGGDQFHCAPQPVHLARNGDWKKMAERYSELVP
ncbi:selenide, water dikinase SelD [Microbulbifer aggregans]|uniref:selenide, water dikinase SelD n=1 Tax=Microbulbifer aggregans TaxID=1769779 RepID=UPI001CFE47FE|nr:selenide, water dikinase SelD [Microbulbifer aggregans]